MSGLKAIWPRRPENNETERGWRVVEHPRSWRLETANDPEGASVPRRGRTSFQWDRACPGCARQRRSGSGYAVRIISELIDGGGYDDPGLSMIVKDAAERQILAIPFSQFR